MFRQLSEIDPSRKMHKKKKIATQKKKKEEELDFCNF